MVEITEDTATSVHGGVNFHKLFVYGTLKRGFGNNRLLYNSEFRGVDVVSGFMMFSKGAFPGVFKVPDVNNCIHGEVFDIDDQVLASCDRLEGVPSFYDRIKVNLKTFGEAYMYVLPAPAGDYKRVIGGSWRGPEQTAFLDVKIAQFTPREPHISRPPLLTGPSSPADIRAATYSVDPFEAYVAGQVSEAK